MVCKSTSTNMSPTISPAMPKQHTTQSWTLGRGKKRSSMKVTRQHHSSTPSKTISKTSKL
jgi:hypothetical protein